MATLAPSPYGVARAILNPPDWMGEPVEWVDRRLGEHLWSRQRLIMESVRDNRYTAVRSCHSSGKSRIASRVVAWWLDSHPVGEAFAVTTAPSAAQVEVILWREIRNAHRSGGLRGRITGGSVPMWKHDEEIIGYGRKPADLTNEEEAATAFQGVHARWVLVVIDEACGVPEWLWNAVDALVTNDECRVLTIGNPDDPSSHFREDVQPTSGWNVIGISAFDTPNFTGEPVPDELRRKLVGRTWVEERAQRWGTDSPLYLSKVLGEFPVDAEDGVVPASWLARCRVAQDDTGTRPNVLGVDVAAGGDESVIAHRLGAAAQILYRRREPDTMKLVDEVEQYALDVGAEAVNVDTIGVGQGVADALRRRLKSRGVRVNGINVGRPAKDSKRFPRLRDELWWEVGRELSEAGAWDLSALPDDAIAQLAAPKYRIDSSGRVKVEGKDELQRRGIASPDLADAVILAFVSPGRPVRRTVPEGRLPR